MKITDSITQFIKDFARCAVINELAAEEKILRAGTDHGLPQDGFERLVVDTCKELYDPERVRGLYRSRVSTYIQKVSQAPEPRMPRDFSPRYYLEQHEDLRKAFGKNNYYQALVHYYKHGHAEDRRLAPPYEHVERRRTRF